MRILSSRVAVRSLSNRPRDELTPCRWSVGGRAMESSRAYRQVLALGALAAERLNPRPGWPSPVSLAETRCVTNGHAQAHVSIRRVVVELRRGSGRPPAPRRTRQHRLQGTAPSPMRSRRWRYGTAPPGPTRRSAWFATRAGRRDVPRRRRSAARPCFGVGRVRVKTPIRIGAQDDDGGLPGAARREGVEVLVVGGPPGPAGGAAHQGLPRVRGRRGTHRAGRR